MDVAVDLSKAVDGGFDNLHGAHFTACHQLRAGHCIHFAQLLTHRTSVVAVRAGNKKHRY